MCSGMEWTPPLRHCATIRYTPTPTPGSQPLVDIPLVAKEIVII